jgi:hypothetical protein
MLTGAGFGHYRFSLSWPRIMPSGSKYLNKRGLAYYNVMIDHILARGITPWVTLYHWDLPQALQEKGGWQKRDIIHRLEEFAYVAGRYFGDRVKNWMVLNEPSVFTGAGYLLGIHAPGVRGLDSFLHAAHHAVLAQAAGARVLRETVPDAHIGTTFSWTHFEPLNQASYHRKAADRLGDAVRSALSRSADPIDAAVQRCLASPTTIHRLLGYRRGLDRSGGGGFRANRANPLAHRLVLVDEVSMVDTALFARLLSAVAPEATLVLLGDPDQLPSVDPGAVLRDLVRARPRGVAVHSLSRSHRMDPTDPDGAHVLGVARACLDPETGRVPFRTLGADAAAADAPVGRGGAWHLEAVELPRVLDAWIARHLLVESLGRLERLDTGDTGAHDAGGTHAPAEVREALEQLARGRILTVTRRSAEDLDAYVSASFARWRGEPARARRVLPGEPVMVIHNDYDEDLWNGDSGVAWRDARGEMHVSFRRGPSFRTRPLAAVAHLIERSHAVTVHKAQGSEHDEVLLVLPPVDTPLSSREIVYTAITRARRSAIVVGRSELLAGALARSSARQTGLVEALAQLDAGGSREREGTHQPAGAA